MGRVVHFEIPADNPERASKFYRDVFGWKIKKWEGSVPYWLITTGPKEEVGIDGGIMHRDQKPKGQGLTAFVCTVDIKNIDQTIEKINKSGGKVITEKMTIPGVGVMAYCKDTEGNQFGIMQSESPT